MRRGFVFAVFLVSAILLSCSTPNKPAEKPDRNHAVHETNDLPDITMMEENGQPFSAASLSGKTVLIFFNADCDHCQRETAEIQKNLDAFKSYTLYFISMDQFSVINRFAEKYKIAHEPNIHLARADGRTVFAAMGPMQTPTICIYTTAKRLAKRFDGETKIGDIIDLL
jgi:peroxiredoxin